MKQKFYILLVVLLATLLSAQAQSTGYNFRDFTNVSASGSVMVVITQGDHYSISVKESKDPNLLTVVEKRGQTLHVYTKNKKRFSKNSSSPTVSITMPRLNGLTASGASEVTLGNLTTGDFSATTSGASHLTMGRMACGAMKLTMSGASELKTDHLAVGSLQLQMSGASSIKTDIQCKGDASMQCSGASSQDLTLKAHALTIANSGAAKCHMVFSGGSVNARNSGAGKMKLDVDCEFLQAKNSGAADFVIKGTADRTDIDLSGTSKINTSALNKY